MEEIVLQGGGRTHLTRKGSIVYRQVAPWTEAVHYLMRHLREAGISEVPRIVGTGYDEFGQETFEYIEGEFVHPGPWSDEALEKIGQLLRRLHNATATFIAPTGATSQRWFLMEIGQNRTVVEHGDFATWNTLTRGGMPIAVIDWEFVDTSIRSLSLPEFVGFVLNCMTMMLQKDYHCQVSPDSLSPRTYRQLC